MWTKDIVSQVAEFLSFFGVWRKRKHTCNLLIKEVNAPAGLIWQENPGLLITGILHQESHLLNLTLVFNFLHYYWCSATEKPWNCVLQSGLFQLFRLILSNSEETYKTRGKELDAGFAGLVVWHHQRGNPSRPTSCPARGPSINRLVITSLTFI